MTSLVRRYLKTAIAFLGVGLTLGGWMLVRRELVGAYPSPYLVSAHTHAILVRFVTVMILGLAEIGASLFLCFFTMWSRIRPPGSQQIEANGERY